MSSVKVGSAKEWKAISRRLTINLDGIDLNEDHSNPPVRPTTPGEFKPTTVQQLRLLCWRIKPWDQPRARNLFSSVLASGWGVDCDEVYPGLFIGDEASARNIRFLHKIGVTHVLNAAEGKWTDCSFVDLSEEYYVGSGICYQGHNLTWLMTYFIAMIIKLGMTWQNSLFHLLPLKLASFPTMSTYV